MNATTGAPDQQSSALEGGVQGRFVTDVGWYRLGALSGILGVILYAAGALILGTPPAPNASSLKVAQDLHTHREGFLASAVLFTLGSTVFFWFVSVVRTALADAEGGRGTMANTFFASTIGAALLTALQLVVPAASAFELADATGAQLAARADVLRFAYDLGNMVAVAGNCFFAFGLFAAAAIILRTHAVAGWLGWLSAGAGVLALLSLGGMLATSGPFAVGGPIYVLGFLSFAVWTFGIGVTLFRHPVVGSARTSYAASTQRVSLPAR